jgi:prepilin-type N-terminal cleavage/methylation domain-containing protein
MQETIFSYLYKNRPGFTLIETMMSLVIFTAIVIPLMSFLYQDTFFAHDRDKIIALCLLDQEGKILRRIPAMYAPVKRKMINGIEWTIKTEKEGTPLITFKLSALKKDKIIGEVLFKAYAAGAN